MIILDDVGRDKFSFYRLGPTVTGYPETPYLVGLRKSGILFSHVYSNPTCGPSRSTIQTGRYGYHTTFGENINVNQPPIGYELPDNEVFLAELVQAAPFANYARGYFGKWHMTTIFGYENHPIDNGYQYFAGSMGNSPDHFNWRKITADGQSIVETQVAGTFDEACFNASVNRADALEWINQTTSPFLACVAFNPPHGPFMVPPSSLLSQATLDELADPLNDGPWFPGDRTPQLPPDTDPSYDILKARTVMFYDAMVEAMDTEINNLINGIDPAKLANTVIIVVGDNGTVAEGVSAPNDPLHAKRTTYDLGTRVPMIVTGPAVKTTNVSCSALINLTDFWRTIADLTSTNASSVSPAGPIDSLSFRAQLELPGSPGQREYAFSEVFGPNGCASAVGSIRAINDGVYKYIFTSGVATEQLYNLVDDPYEVTNLMGPSMTPAEQAAYTELSAAMAAMIAGSICN